MTEQWRLLLTGDKSAFDNMATDEAILRCVVEDKSSSTMRFYGWQPSAVSIGYFQGIEQEVDLDVCREKGVDVIRRLTGGGAVFHDHDGEITYSLAVKESHPRIPRKVMDSYGLLCGGLVAGFERLGIDAEFKPINDIIVNGKKISGSAQTRRFGGVLQHGTLLCDVDPHLMFTLLKVPNEKIRDKLIQGVEERVTSVRREMGIGDVSPVDKDAVIRAMVAGFERVLGIELVPGALSDEELALAERIKAERYATKAWVFKR
jgi:lipoate-protein ligase A